MEISLFDIISFGFAIICFVYALIERSKRLPLWHIIKGLEKGAMSNLALYDEIRKKYSEDDRDSIPIKEFLVQLDNAIGCWRSQRELIIGIRQSISKRKE
ncbi:MAG: hypothetical protein QQN41_12190 [Nitrosopumilus sp.]